MRQTMCPQGRRGTPSACAGWRFPARALLVAVAILPGLLVAQVPPEADGWRMTAGSAIPDDPGLLQRPSPAGTAPSDITAEVRVRLGDDLGEWTDAVRAAALSSKAARIAEPAEVELRTRRNFPLTLQLANAWEPEELWQLVFADDGDPWMPERMPRTIELGNLVLGDYVAPLREELDRLGRVNALLASAAPAGAARTPTCFIPGAETPVAPTCDVPIQGGAGAEPLPIDTDEPVRFAVGNRSAHPQHVALLFVDSDKRITPVALQGDGPLAPGAWVQSDGSMRIRNRGAYWLVTLASEQPLAIDPARPDSALGEGVSATVSRHDLLDIPVVPIGGGVDAPGASAPWMADFYSTVPYTYAEIEADARKPRAEREYLRERAGNPGELAHRCGGTLIAADLVVTAAHCVAKGDFEGENATKVLTARRVRLGSLWLGKGGGTYAIDAMAVHGAYRPGKMPHDIALLRLKADRDATHHLGTPITLLAGRDPTPPLQAGAPFLAYGWGYTGVVAPRADPLFNESGELQRNPGRLQVGELEAQGWDTCKERLGDDLGPRMLCAVSRTDPRTRQAPRHVFSCRGGSGGPLVRAVDGQPMLVGVASWSRGCGYGDFPSVYTNVSRYAAWLELARKQLRSGQVVRCMHAIASRPGADKPMGMEEDRRASGKPTSSLPLRLVIDGRGIRPSPLPAGRPGVYRHRLPASYDGPATGIPEAPCATR